MLLRIWWLTRIINFEVLFVAYWYIVEKVLFCFRILWPGIVNIRRRERNQQDATNPMFIFKLLSQHVSGIIMHIIRRIRPCPTVCGVLPGCVGCGSAWMWINADPQDQSQPWPTQTVQNTACRRQGLILLTMCIMMPEICRDRNLIRKIELVASCWFSLTHILLCVAL